MQTQKIHDNKNFFPYIIRVPEQMKENLPLIVQLHGAGERGDGRDENLDVVETHGFPNLITDEKEYECILVMPQCPSGSFWVAQIPNIKSFIMSIVQEYKCDADRVYLTGFSMGGYGTWFTAMAYPDMFAAIAPCCGGGMPWNAGVLSMPVWAFHGMQDKIVLPYETENMIRGMEEAGLKPKLTLFPDCAHASWVEAYNEELLFWILSQKRNRRQEIENE